MKKIEWNDSLSVHHAEIDAQHQKWITIFNNLHEVLIGDDEKALRTAGRDALAAMQDYANFHFKFEEEYMASINFPDGHKHRRLHKEFDNQIFAYNREMSEGRMVLNTEIIKMIGNWLMNHIGVEDQKYARFLEQQSDT